MKRFSLFTFLATFIIIGIAACRKKNDTPPPVQEKKTFLVKETRSNGATLDYKYDSQNRFASQSYRDASNHQETFTTQFAANNLPSETIFRDYTNNRASKYNYTYDAQNRCTKIEVRDSINASTYTLRATYDFTYTAAKITRFITNAATGATSRNEITIDANGNFLKEQTFKADGAMSFEYTYTGYDDKKNPRNATFTFLFIYPATNNNNTAYSGGLVGGTVNNFTLTHTYNTDGYPTQTVFNNGFTYNYTYEKR